MPKFYNKRVFLTCSLALPAMFGLGVDRAQAQASGRQADDKEANAFIDTLYAERIAKVQRTRETEDDVALMQEMLEIAPTLPSSKPDARSAIYVRIVDMLDRSKTGYEIAIKALETLAEQNPKHPSASTTAKLDVYNSWYRAADRSEREAAAGRYFEQLIAAADAALERGDHENAKRWYNEAGSIHRVARLDTEFDLREKLLATREIEKIDSEVASLQAIASKGELTSDQARHLVLLMSLELGKFEDAKVYARAIDDEAFVKGFKSAAQIGGLKPTSRASDQPVSYWLAAGNWYADLIEDPTLRKETSDNMLVLARTALKRYVDSTNQEDIDKARAVIRLRQLDEKFAAAQPGEDKGETSGDTVDVLAMLDPAKHVISGEAFFRREDTLVIPAKTIVHLPVEGGKHFVISVKAKPSANAGDAMMIWVPIGNRTARFFLNAGGQLQAKFDGLNYIEGSEKTLRMSADKTTNLKIECRVLPDDQAALKVWSDDRQIWQWRGEAEKFKQPGYGIPSDPKHFSIRGAAGLIVESLSVTRIDDDDKD